MVPTGCTRHARSTCSWRRPAAARCAAPAAAASTSEEESCYSLQHVVSVMASSLALDYREWTCTGPTGRRNAHMPPHSFYHPISVDLVNGDDESNAVVMTQVPGPMVSIMLDALDTAGRPLKYFEQLEQQAPRSSAQYESCLPVERAAAMLQRATALTAGVGRDRWRYDPVLADDCPSLLDRCWGFDACQLFNVGAALALRAWLRERRGVLLLPSGARITAEGVRVVQVCDLTWWPGGHGRRISPSLHVCAHAS